MHCQALLRRYLLHHNKQPQTSVSLNQDIDGSSSLKESPSLSDKNTCCNCHLLNNIPIELRNIIYKAVVGERSFRVVFPVLRHKHTKDSYSRPILGHSGFARIRHDSWPEIQAETGWAEIFTYDLELMLTCKQMSVRCHLIGTVSAYRIKLCRESSRSLFPKFLHL